MEFFITCQVALKDGEKKEVRAGNCFVHQKITVPRKG